MPTSNPPAAGTPSFLEGLTLESVVDVSSIPSAHSSHTSEETEDTDTKAPKKKARTETDPEEVTSSLSGSAKQQDLTNPIPVVPLSSAPPAGSSKPPRLFGISR